MHDDSFFKCVSKGKPISLKLLRNGITKIIWGATETKAYEILRDPAKRRLYDSVDYGIPDPQPPKVVHDFFETFRPIFELEAR